MKSIKKLTAKLAGFALLVLALASCHPFQDSLSTNAYVQWVENPENGLQRSKRLGELDYVLQYMPVSYQLLRQQRGKAITATLLKSQEEQQGGVEQYRLRIALNRGKADLIKHLAQDPSEEQALRNYFAFGIRQQLRLEQDGKTFPCKLLHFVPNYGLSPYADFIVGFDAPSQKGDRRIILEENYLNTGILQFEITQQALDLIPELTLDHHEA